MDETVTLKPSRLLLAGLSMVYLLFLSVTFLVISSPPFLLLSVVVLGLFYAGDRRRFRQDHLQYRIRADGMVIVWHLNAETCYSDCRMYYNRWCMVMKLKNSRHCRSIVLTADRFKDAADYAVARYQLMRLQERCDAA